MEILERKEDCVIVSLSEKDIQLFGKLFEGYKQSLNYRKSLMTTLSTPSDFVTKVYPTHNFW